MFGVGDFIVKVKEDNYYCMICNCYLTSDDSVLDHTTDEIHKNGMQKYMSDILLIGDNHQYYCSICDRLISGYFNVYIYINGRKHTNLLCVMDYDKQEEEEEIEDEEEEEGVEDEGEEEEVEDEEEEEEVEVEEEDLE